MSELTPILLTALQIVATLFFLIVIMKIAKVELDRHSLVITIGVSIFLGYFLFLFVEIMVVCFVAIVLLRLITIRWKQPKTRFVPPELEEAKDLDEQEY